jgi:hypothetical protein
METYSQIWPDVVAICLLLFFGLGSYRRLKWVIDPPKWLFFCYSQSFYRCFMTPEQVRTFTMWFCALFAVLWFGLRIARAVT